LSNIIVSPPDSTNRIVIELPLSKSITNRMLVIGFLAGDISRVNVSTSGDSVIMNSLIRQLISRTGNNIPESLLHDEFTSTFDAGDAGTVFRFLTAVLSVTPGRWYLTGSNRMKQRPVAPLVEALKALGAEINYIENEGFAPLSITGKKLRGGKVKIDSGISSQFISALMMIAPILSEGLELSIQGERVSWPYITLTANLMKDCGAEVVFSNNIITIRPSSYYVQKDLSEGDWSAASYWFSLVSLKPESSLILKGLKKDSYQGDSILTMLFRNLGVHSHWTEQGLLLEHTDNDVNNLFIDLRSNPDLAPALAVACAGKNINAVITGLQTLVIKESNRLDALQSELHKLGYVCIVKGNDSLHIHALGNNNTYQSDESLIGINTYNDHRIAMALSILAIKRGAIIIRDYDVVNKSYPDFWHHLKNAGFEIQAV